MERSLIAAVVGARGDLGSQVTSLLQRHGYTVTKVQRGSNFLQLRKEHFDVVHYCIPAQAVKRIGDDTTLHIFHDSVMHSSMRVIRRKFANYITAPVHMLMNQSGTAVVGRGSTGSRLAKMHLEALGLNVVMKDVAAHDKIVARSQAPMLVLSNTILKDLKKWEAAGLLTPSGEDLLKALESRSARWTQATKKSILKNPQIKTFIDDMRRLH